MALIGTVLTIITTLLILITPKQYRAYIEGLSEKEHPLKDIYPTGFFLLEKFVKDFNTPRMKKRYQECRVIYDEKYAQFYLRLSYAEKIAVIVMFMPLPFLLCAMLGSWVGLVIGFLVIGGLYYYFETLITDVLKKRKSEIDTDFANVISQLALLINAGMILPEAWEKVSRAGDSTIYQEMREAVVDMNNGMSERDALLKFASRSMHQEVKKFTATLVQSSSKGGSDLTDYLVQQSSLAWEAKKQNVKQQGEKASTKLLIPILIMFAGILILVIVPMLSSFSLSF